MRIRCLLVIAAVLASSTTSALPASAEWFVDLYAGAASTRSNEVFITGTDDATDPQPYTLRSRSVDFDDSLVFGGRVGYWDETWSWLGLALDVSHFRPDVGRQAVATILNESDGTITMVPPSCSIPSPSPSGCFARLDLSVTAISFDLMLRWPLSKSQQYPKGRVQPYMSAGVALFVTAAEDTTNFGPPNNQSDVDASVGVKVGAGVAWQFHKNLALFGEYRFTHFRPELSFSPSGVGVAADRLLTVDAFGNHRLEMDINTHHLVLGVSFRF